MCVLLVERGVVVYKRSYSAVMGDEHKDITRIGVLGGDEEG